MDKRNPVIKMVKVTWIDAVSDDPWSPIDEAVNLEPHQIESVGFLLYRDKRKIIFAASYDEENQDVAGVWAIPATWALEIKEL